MPDKYHSFPELKADKEYGEDYLKMSSSDIRLMRDIMKLPDRWKIKSGDCQAKRSVRLEVARRIFEATSLRVFVLNNRDVATTRPKWIELEGDIPADKSDWFLTTIHTIIWTIMYVILPLPRIPRHHTIPKIILVLLFLIPMGMALLTCPPFAKKVWHLNTLSSIKMRLDEQPRPILETPSKNHKINKNADSQVGFKDIVKQWLEFSSLALEIIIAFALGEAIYTKYWADKFEHGIEEHQKKQERKLLRAIRNIHSRVREICCNDVSIERHLAISNLFSSIVQEIIALSYIIWIFSWTMPGLYRRILRVAFFSNFPGRLYGFVAYCAFLLLLLANILKAFLDTYSQG